LIDRFSVPDQRLDLAGELAAREQHAAPTPAASDADIRA